VTSTDEPAAPTVASPVEPRPAHVTYQDDPLRHLGQSQRRGDLRIYLGAAPGVGKTCAMLGEAHRRLERGTDVVAAVVETHGRKKVGELIKGIEVIPPHYISYRGGTFPELDVEAVLQRKPEVALVDEYAHSNIPGSAHDPCPMKSSGKQLR
jgi:two-component system, OmpR family, sensor histidine kinase KdpD